MKSTSMQKMSGNVKKVIYLTHKESCQFKWKFSLFNKEEPYKEFLKYKKKNLMDAEGNSRRNKIMIKGQANMKLITEAPNSLKEEVK